MVFLRELFSCGQDSGGFVTTIASRCFPGMFFENLREITGVSETDPHGDFGHGIRRRRQQIARFLHPHMRQIFGKAPALHLLEKAAEVAGAEVHLLGHVLQTDLFLIIVLLLNSYFFRRKNL